MKKLLLAAALVLLTTTAFALPITAKLSWTMPNTTVGGQPINADTAITGSKIYCGQAAGVYTVTKDVGLVAAYQVSDIPLTVGAWFCVVTVRNKYGESNFSNELNFNIDGSVPMPPLNLQIQ